MADLTPDPSRVGDYLTTQSNAELINVLKLGNQNTSFLIKTLAQALDQAAQRTALAVTYNSTTAASSGAILVTASTTYLVSLNVTVASSNGGTGKVYDCATVANAGSTNLIATIGSCVGFTTFNWPIQYGLVVQPSSQSQVVSVSYV